MTLQRNYTLEEFFSFQRYESITVFQLGTGSGQLHTYFSNCPKECPEEIFIKLAIVLKISKSS